VAAGNQPTGTRGGTGIVNEIILKLQIWVKGYLWIIIIESAIYVTLFFILGVPYFAVLGMIAGLTILLPFIGPIASALLTITVFYAVAPPSVAIVLIIVLAYVIMNGVIEQLFLYPALVGEALGLNVLETIIVVLIGGLVAGLAGVIFAVPAASAMKFLIPKLYATWRPATSNPPPEEKRHHG
jgi:predicted PurR-regulated permease PerM